MFSRVRLCLGVAVAAAVLGGTASAATVSSLSMQHFDRSQLSDAQKAMSDHLGGITVKALDDAEIVLVDTAP